MISKKSKQLNYQRRHRRVRAKISGTAERPRLTIFKSNQHTWVQLIDDVAGRTILAVSDLELKDAKKNSKEKTEEKMSEKIGELIAQKAVALKITEVVFDRGGRKYHGFIKTVAESARQGGLKI